MAIPLVELSGGRTAAASPERAGAHPQRESRDERNSQAPAALAAPSLLRLPALPSAVGSEPRTAASAAETLPLRTLEVVGSGEARVQPDHALLSLGVHTRALSARQGASENHALVRRVINALDAELDGRGRVWVGACTLQPEIEHARGREKPVVIGYHASNSVNVETGAIDQLGPLIDAALAAGASAINSLDFTSVEDAQARGAAIQRACCEAQAQADALARSLAIRLERIIKATTKAGVRRIHAPADESTASFAATGGAPVVYAQPGEITIAATVSIIYQIE
ncbi:MAG TPA: SIMPL domain-containing protein [Candidatus Binataceae bacterium]|jgi:uncharacterized protein YggE|nr:SIMPL domain-containing protein [Candidatus Binataceae bacterium]